MNRQQRRAAARWAREKAEDAATVARWARGTEAMCRRLRGQQCDCGRTVELAVITLHPVVEGDFVVATVFDGVSTCARCLNAAPPVPPGTMVLDLHTLKAAATVRVNCAGGVA